MPAALGDGFKRDLGGVNGGYPVLTWQTSECMNHTPGDAVNEDGFREVLGAAEGMKEDKASWVSFFQWLRGRGLDGVKLIVGDKCMGMLEDMRHSKMVSLRVCYFAGGIVNLYKQWFRGDLDCSLNDIAMEVSKLLQLEAQELFGD